MGSNPISSSSGQPCATYRRQASKTFLSALWSDDRSGHEQTNPDSPDHTSRTGRCAQG